MKKILFLVVSLFFVLQVQAQKMTVKDSDTNILMEVNDEGLVGSISLPSGSAPSTTTSKLYNVGGALYWNGAALGMAGSAGGWTDGGANVYTTTSTDKVGIGTSTPEFKLSLDTDGGIKADGKWGSGVTLSAVSEGAHLIWYPRKAAFRAGYVGGSQWDDSNVVDYSTAMGNMTTASGPNSTAMGVSSTASGNAATAMGDYTRASGNSSTAMGSNSLAQSEYCVAIGRNNEGGGTADDWISSDPLFEIGIGSDPSNRANALTVLKNGKVGIGTNNPAGALDVRSTTQGFLPPRMTTSQRNAISLPPEGLLVYNTSTHKMNYYNGASWVEI